MFSLYTTCSSSALMPPCHFAAFDGSACCFPFGFTGSIVQNKQNLVFASCCSSACLHVFCHATGFQCSVVACKFVPSVSCSVMFQMSAVTTCVSDRGAALLFVWGFLFIWPCVSAAGATQLFVFTAPDLVSHLAFLLKILGV